MSFIIGTQSEKWEQYKQQMGTKSRDKFLYKVQTEIEVRGTHYVFSKPLKIYIEK